MELVSVIIINFNGQDFLQGCLDSLFSQDYSSVEIIAIDNASTDGSLDILKAKSSQLKLVANDTNLGFAGAFNQGVNLSKGDFIMSVNPDIVLSQNFIPTMITEAKADTKIGSLSGKLIRRAKGEEGIIDSAGHVMFKNRLSINRGDGEKDKGQYDQKEYVFGTCGAAALYRRAMLEGVKANKQYFDEDFFAFWEDIDLDWRAQLYGWKCLYVPEAVAYHFRGGIRFPRPRIVELSNYRNRYFTIIKNDYLWGLAKNLPQIIFTDFLKNTTLLFRCPSALFLGSLDILKFLPKMLSKRRAIQKRITVKPREIEKKWFRKFNYRKWIKKHLPF